MTGRVGLDAARRAVKAETTGTLALCLAIAPVMAARGGGVIVNVCSDASLVQMLLNGIFRESLAARNIRVAAINLTYGEIKALQSDHQQTQGATLREVTDAMLSLLLHIDTH